MAATLEHDPQKVETGFRQPAWFVQRSCSMQKSGRKLFKKLHH